MTSIEVRLDFEPSDYAWIIDRDHLTGEGGEYYTGPKDDEKGVSGPHNANITNPGTSYLLDKEELTLNYEHHHQFRMYDDDGELYYTGTLFWNGSADDPWDDYVYGPLIDYGGPNAGAVLIKYTGRPEWDCG